ncbi:MAG TPA: hypothetical protein VMW11_01615 [Candidatus Dormibacteraeota bacterium]|nr:hypothetical protein [Candidatus Dormibacteraeota bacterium]
MSKRKRATPGKTSGSPDQAPVGDDTDDAAPKDDMAHVSPDILSGSPDIFASRPAEPGPGLESEPSTGELPAVTSEPITPEDMAITPAQPPVTEAIATTESKPALVPAEPAAATPAPPFPVTAESRPPHRRSAGSSMALGIVLVVVGLFALGVVMFGIDLTQYGWPLFVIIPGITLLVVGFVGVGASASIPGGIITMLGLVLAYQSSTGDWPSWAFAWALIVPGGLGLGMYLQALRDRDTVSLKRGRTLMFVGVMIFMIGFVLFESILGISNTDYGWFGKAALPLLLIVIGIILLARSVQRSRRA